MTLPDNSFPQTAPNAADLLFTDDLRQEPRWMCYRVSGENADNKFPISPLNGNPASSTDPSTWTTFDVAQQYAREHGLYLGLAINNSLRQFTPLTAIDYDHVCAHGEQPPAWVAAVCSEINSFTERSVSGTGFHTLVYGDLPNSRNVTGATIEKNVFGGDQKVELFAHKMIVVTGDLLEGSTASIRKVSADKLAELAERARAGFGQVKKTVASVTTANLVAEGRLSLLERAGDDGDRSAGDKEYVALLAEMGLSDAEIDERFRASARTRPKWDERHASDGKTYGEMTIAHVRKAHAQKLKGEPVIDPAINPNDWRSLFHTYEEILNAPPLRFAIEGFLQEDGITFFGGPPGHGKTLIMLNVVKALPEGGKLFDHFKVNSVSNRVLYLIPESGLGPLVHRLKLFRLIDHVKSGKLFVRTMSTPVQNVSLADPRILKASEGADVFLDTAIRFSEGEENSASDNRKFAQMLFNLQTAGARTIVGAHHSPKGNPKTGNSEAVTLDNALRGSGDIGAMLCTCWGVRQVNESVNRVYVKNVKARDFEACSPFEIEGRDSIDETGSFKMTAAPGLGKLPRNVNPRWAEASRLLAEGMSQKQVAAALDITDRTLRAWKEEGHLGAA